MYRPILIFLLFCSAFCSICANLSAESIFCEPIAVIQPPEGLPVDPNGLSLERFYAPAASFQPSFTMASVDSPSPPPPTYPFDITIIYNGSWTPEQIDIFEDAEALWESWILEYKPGIALPGLTIDATSAYIDGPGNILGQAGWTSGVYAGGYAFALEGEMTFDEDDVLSMVGSGWFDEVVAHEMAHVIGFGTLWTYNDVYTDDTGQYTGADALAMYRMEFQDQSGADYVPVELEGGEGTVNSHWNEGVYGGATGILNMDGVDMRYELMTGWLNTYGVQQFLSQTTVQSFSDMGYVVPTVSLPEPSSLAMMGLGLLGLARIVRRWGK